MLKLSLSLILCCLSSSVSKVLCLVVVPLRFVLSILRVKGLVFNFGNSAGLGGSFPLVCTFLCVLSASVVKVKGLLLLFNFGNSGDFGNSGNSSESQSLFEDFDPFSRYVQFRLSIIFQPQLHAAGKPGKKLVNKLDRHDS